MSQEVIAADRNQYFLEIGGGGGGGKGPNVQPLTVEPGRFGYNLVQAELTFDGPGTIEARCRVDQGPVTSVPLTVTPAVEAV